MLTIGIDLGTSNCCISYINDKGEIVIIKQDDNITIPSLVCINKNGYLIGNEVNKSHIFNNKNIFHSFKRLIGHNLNDVYSCNLKEILFCKLKEDDKNNILMVDENDKEYTLQEVIFILLSKIKEIIVKHLGHNNWNCIVTIPAYFNEHQRSITMQAIEMSGLNIKKLMNEPTAASFSYLFKQDILNMPSFERKILVIDYGAGTLDLSVIEIIKEEYEDKKDNSLFCEVLGIYGDNNFGGIDITKVIYKTLFNKDSINFSDLDSNTKYNICESIKIELSNQFDVKYYSDELDKFFYYDYSLFLDQLEYFNNMIVNSIEKVLEISKLKKEKIDEVLLVGGSFKMQYFRDCVSNFFSRPIFKLIDEDTSVSIGSSVYGYFFNMSKDVTLIEKLPLSIGVETSGGTVAKILERGITIPTNKTRYFQKSNKEDSDIELNIYQGESIFKKDCFLLANLVIKDVPDTVININIGIDNNGIINVSVNDRKNTFKNNIQIDIKDNKLSDNKIKEILDNYEVNKTEEKLYKNIVNNYYKLSTILSKLSYQINYNKILKDKKEITDIVKKDLELIINKMLNKFIRMKYNLNINLIKSIIIINSLKIVEKEYIELDTFETEEYLKLLKYLVKYLTSRYEVYIINDNFDDLQDFENQTRLCSINNDDDQDNSKYFDFSRITLENIVEKSTSIFNRQNKENDYEAEYFELVNQLTESIDYLGLNTEGINILLEKLKNNVSNFSQEDFKKEIENINELSVNLYNNYCIK